MQKPTSLLIRGRGGPPLAGDRRGAGFGAGQPCLGPPSPPNTSCLSHLTHFAPVAPPAFPDIYPSQRSLGLWAELCPPPLNSHVEALSPRPFRLLALGNTEPGTNVPPSQFQVPGVSVSWGCCDRVPHTEGLKTTELWSLPVQRASSPTSGIRGLGSL